MTETQYLINPVDMEHFSSNSIGALEHNYHDHPLFQLNRIKELAHFLMARKKCRFAKAGFQLDSEFYHYDESPDGRSLDQVFDNISEPESWIALYHVEYHPDYKALIEEMLREAAPLFEKEQGKCIGCAGFLFISAPPAITPFHIDRENNFWLQIKGEKKLSVFDRYDKDIVAPEDVEQFIVHRSLDNVTLPDKYAERAQCFNVKMGQGVYFPSTSPHMTETTNEWVVPGDEISMSIGIVFYTELTRKVARIHQFNNFIRKFGLKPSPPGKNRLIDNGKAFLGRIIALLMKNFRGYNPPLHSY